MQRVLEVLDFIDPLRRVSEQQFREDRSGRKAAIGIAFVQDSGIWVFGILPHPAHRVTGHIVDQSNCIDGVIALDSQKVRTQLAGRNRRLLDESVKAFGSAVRRIRAHDVAAAGEKIGCRR